MEFTEIMDIIRSPSSDTSDLTPVKPRLGKFIDVYSPQHLNLSPDTQKPIPRNFLAEVNNDHQNILTPERLLETDFKCWTAKPEAGHKSGLMNCSFEGNQSFPRVSRHIRPIKMELETPSKIKSSDLVRVDGPNGLRFNSTLASGELTVPSQSQSERLQQAISPTKAVFTIEPDTSKILIVNSKACSLLGYSSGELCGLPFSDLILSRGSKAFSLQDAGNDPSEDGTNVLLSGKVVELLAKDGSTVQVSLWIRRLDGDGPCLVVAEPVHCKNIVLTIDAETGVIVSCDLEEAAVIFQAESREQLLGLPITSLIPSIQLPIDGAIPKHISKQKATGRTLDGGSFPLCLWLSSTDADSSQRTMKYQKDRPVCDVNIRVTFNVNGLLVLDESGIITACNHHFTRLTFGKSHSEVIGHHIEEIIPNFCRETDMVKSERVRRITLSPVNNEDDGSASDTDDDSCGAFNGSQKSACISNVPQSLLSNTREKSSSALCLDKSCDQTHTPTPTQDMVSSISTTEQRNDTSALPDVTSGMSGISIDEENYCFSSISKSRSENILRSEQANVIKPTMILNEKSESIYYTSQHSQEVTPTGNTPRIRTNDPSLRLSLDSSKYRSMKAQVKDVNDKSSISLDFCDSNETSADFLTPINEMPPPGCEIEDLPRHNGTESVDSLSNDIDLETQTESVPPKRYEDEPPITPCVPKRLLRTHVTTSTPQRTSKCKSEHCECGAGASGDCQHRDGTYRGVVLHRDGTELTVLYTVSSMKVSTGRVRCVWLGVQTLEDGLRHTTLASSAASTADNSLVLGMKSVSSRPQSMSLISQCGEEQIAGEYSKHYVTLKQIGKGAYGCVKMAYRRSDKLLAVAKFILKEKVGAQFWVDGPDGRKVPLELNLLMTLKHPNIVSVLDVFENDNYFQMVMEKHGAGMDLFEFIERRPRLDEPLLSYIFRQIGQAVEYLHSLNILHRDIKDENVIIDNKFHVKLIDFGSATFMSKDTLFSTFYGTTEYCSPEVLAGNKYAGPELEMWSMGITLYVLTFFINPFTDIEDTIQGELLFPQDVSADLEQLLRWMLCKEPSLRCTVPQLMAHAWIRQPVPIATYCFHEILDCDRHEASPEMYYTGSSPHTGSAVSLADPLAKERSNPSEALVRSDGKNLSRSEPKRNSLALIALCADREHSDNYSLRSSADILDISSKPVSEAALTDISSDATGHAACDIDYDCDQYECDSWDECEQDSFS